MRAWLVDPDPPTLGIEIRRRSVAALRLARGRRTIEAAASVPLPEGVLAPSMTKGNVLEPALLGQALRQAVERVGGLRERRAALVLPDAVARIVLLNGADLAAAKGSALDSLVRFKLRERAPFDPRQAQVAWQGSPGARGDALLVVASQRSIIETYEGACQAVGIVPGVVEISTLALLRGTEQERRGGDWLLINWDDDCLSLLVTRDRTPLLVRTLVGQTSRDDLLRELATTILYHQDRLAGQGLAGALLRSGPVTPSEVAAEVEGAVGGPLVVIDPLARLGAPGQEEAAQAMAGVACGMAAWLA
jgi:hypothetical protein